MSTKFIFLLFFAFFIDYTNAARSYPVKDESALNEDEDGFRKRSSEEDPCSHDYFITNIKKDLTDFDYRNGNTEPDTDDHESDEEEELKSIRKRETKVLADIQSFSDADIEQALSKLSEPELEVLEKVMDSNEDRTSTIKKRGIVMSESDKMCDSRYGCSHDCADHSYEQSIRSAQRQPGEGHKSSRMFKRFSRFSPLSRDEIMSARIDFLKDNYKRQSEIGKLENSFKIKERYQRNAAAVKDDGMRNPYFNSLIGPRSRAKRSIGNDSKKSVNPMDDPKSSEHIKLLEESFPNPSVDNSLRSDQQHIRVKRA